MCFDSKSLVDCFGQFFQSAHFSFFRTDWPRALAGESLKRRNWMAQFVSLSLVRDFPRSFAGNKPLKPSIQSKSTRIT